MATDQEQDYAKQYGKVMARAWGDSAFKAKLLANPTDVLRANGVQIPTGMEVRLYENSEKVVYLPMMKKPTDTLSDEQLEQVAGGTTAGTAGTLSTFFCLPIGSSLSTAASAGTAGTAG